MTTVYAVLLDPDGRMAYGYEADRTYLFASQSEADRVAAIARRILDPESVRVRVLDIRR